MICRESGISFQSKERYWNGQCPTCGADISIEGEAYMPDPNATCDSSMFVNGVIQPMYWLTVPIHSEGGGLIVHSPARSNGVMRVAK